MRSLWPMITPGTPEKPKPGDVERAAPVDDAALQADLMPDARQRSAPRCGSLASSGIPLSVRSPDTTHEFEPMPSPTSPTSALTASMTPSTSDHSIDAVVTASGVGTRRADARRLRDARDRRHDDRVAVERVPRVELGDLVGGEVRRERAPARSRPRCWSGGPRPSPSATPPSRRASRARSRSRGSADRGPRTRRMPRRRRGRRGRRSRPRRRRRSRRGSSGRAPRPPARRSRASRACAGTCRSPSCDSPNSSETRPAGHVPAEVHLPEAVLRVHVPLREEEVVGARRR